ncbi:Histidine operon leader [Salmonella enterica subsp. enterica serovar Agona str. 22.H.04]|nr:Histidine operon leader [Salmonella enterica subsp. enterica serovar Agona str. 73.H.09]CCR04822.1 Histidine operon leader [Salmonella enterica subsp. enterica serovar Agona str. 72.A.52]CCR11456.1 Histidine operon leader [Salmonella enterica subsp. enterica serovar Agona str. 71.E.05]CCR15963.1 Histidine operon leader [Salmonella enterica subsp. enterica serovar Agona str. 70.E.05]CCR17867.1 Histidine operon leader [Salmonella enterica subsp. enterica serovar Agona str. 69.H.06]CCR25184.1 
MCAGRHSDLPVVHERMRKPPEDHLPGAFFWRAIQTGSDRIKRNAEC